VPAYTSGDVSVIPRPCNNIDFKFLSNARRIFSGSLIRDDHLVKIGQFQVVFLQVVSAKSATRSARPPVT